MIYLTTTQWQYETLHEQVQGKAKTVKVDATALMNLLVDHARLIRELRERGGRVVEPQPENQPTGRVGKPGE